jgi:predicted DNA-binding transcriptional regulator YafY
MPGSKNQTFRIKIIDDLLSRKEWVKTSLIKQTIESKLLEPVSDRTINQDITDMKENTLLGYYAPIIYSRSKRAYSYSEPGYTIKNFALSASEVDALKFYAECLQVFSGYKLFDEFTSGIEKVINGVQTRRKLKPSTDVKLIVQADSLVTAGGGEYMGDLVHAIEEKLICEIGYLPYGRKIAYNRFAIPLLLKEYKNRWYLLASRTDNNEIRTYALDRIINLKVTDDVAKGILTFDPENYFEHSFGIITPDAPVEEIRLRFNKKQAPYILSLPVHKTQKILERTNSGIVISISVILSYEVYEFILSKTPEVEVLSPPHLVQEIAQKLMEAAKFYDSSKK